MVVSRAVQGFALGAVPLGISIMRDELPPKRHRSARALMSSSLGVGGALAIPLAALVARNVDWHWLFFGAAAIGAVAMAAIAVGIASMGLAMMMVSPRGGSDRCVSGGGSG